MKNLRAWINLVNTPEIGYAKAQKLVKEFGEPINYVGEKAKILDEVSYIPQISRDFLNNNPDPLNWQKIKKLIEIHEIKFTSILDERYPTMLKNIFNAPLFFFYKGDFSRDDFRRTIAIVGTRKASNYGLLTTNQLVTQLVKAGFTIVSGLAYGIDTVAHQTTLDNGGRTIAVVATGCDQVYPPRNKSLAEKILNNGAIISEYLPGAHVEKWNFPQRNRIISALSLGTLVVEGSKKSGALLTAKFALEQGRDIFAIPGDINKPLSEGPNYLIQLGAKLVTKVEDILNEYELLMNQSPQMEFFPELDKEEDYIYQLLLQNKPEMEFDNLIIKSAKPVSELSSILLRLEMKSIIKYMPGNKIAPLF